MAAVTVDTYKQLLETARAAYQQSYAPYSKYRVGAAILTKDGKVFPGCNLEVVSYDSICAERAALTNALIEGHREFQAIALVAEQNAECWPCGVCRQYLAEFGLDMVVAVPAHDGSVKTMTLGELLPNFFPPSALLK